MAVRPIDTNALLDHIKDLNTWYNDDGYIYGYDMKYPDGMFFPDDIIASIENTPTLTQPNEWVSVENALPPEHEPVLCIVSGNPKPNVTLEDAYQLGSWNKADG